MDFARQKARRQFGVAIDRKTPLLPEVVTALLRWRAVHPGGPRVFLTARAGPYARDRQYRDFLHLIHAAKGKDDDPKEKRDEDAGAWTPKSLRNVGPSLARAKIGRAHV